MRRVGALNGESRELQRQRPRGVSSRLLRSHLASASSWVGRHQAPTEKGASGDGDGTKQDAVLHLRVPLG